MTYTFDQIKALKEEISGLNDIRISLVRREGSLQAKFTELEVEVNAVAKLRGFADAELDRKRAILKRLTEEK